MAVLARRPRVSLADDVVAELRERILSGVYQPGSRLHQERVAEDLGLSRTPVREALRTLEHEGLVIPEPGGGVRVSSRDPRMLLIAYELREVVDGLSARLAAQSKEKAWQTRLRASLREQEVVLMDEEWSPAAWTQANAAFHGLIIEASQNPYLGGLQHFVHSTSQVFRPMSVLGKDRAEQAYEEHRDIAAALISGDATAAERLARQHIRVTVDAITSHLEDTTVDAARKETE